MKQLYLFLAPFLLLQVAAFGQVQVENGSFEMDGAPSLSGWEWTCEDPELIDVGAPSSGTWSVTKEVGNVKGCFPSFIYQRLPNVQNSELHTLSGWVRCTAPDFCPGAYIGFGTVNNGVFHSEENVGVDLLIWTFVDITDTIELNTGDTAIVILTSGITGGPVAPSKAAFDGLSLSIAQSISELPGPALALRMDHATGILHVAATSGIRSIALLDPRGREVAVTVRRTSATSAQLNVSELPGGIYLVQALTEKGILAERVLVGR